MNRYIPLQKEFQSDPWKMLICCICLNLTNRKQVRSIIYDFFKRYPDPQSIIDCDLVELVEILKPLGLSNKRAVTIKKFSGDWLVWDGVNVKDLYGIGNYGSDSWEIFQKGNLDVKPKDGVLGDYLKEIKNP
jgi:methyl-CpG-binding domain protein 4